MTIGIYCLKFSNTTKVYIGKSKNIETRFNIHRQNLLHGRGSKKLQEAYNTFGMPILEIIVESTEEELTDLEKEAVNIYNSYLDGFNSTQGGEDGHWEGLPGDKNPGSLYSGDQIRAAFKMLLDTKNTNKIISATTGVSTHVIINISCGRGHKWLEEEFPVEYKTLLDLKGNRYSGEAMGIVYPPLKSPDGLIYSNISNAKAFCINHNLTPTHIAKLFKGKAKSHKGWTLA